MRYAQIWNEEHSKAPDFHICENGGNASCQLPHYTSEIPQAH